MIEFFDSHSHYNDEKFDQDRKQIIEACYQDGITNLIVAGYHLPSSKAAIALSREYDFIHATCGISPNDIENLKEEDLKKVEFLAKQEKKIVAIGEIGLDYYWHKENKEKQKEVFQKQIDIANRLDLPIVIHCREAYSDTIQILKTTKPKKAGVFHCCPLHVELIKEAILLGFFISFAGPVTFQNAKHSRDAIAAVPLERLLVETDSPYLAPDGLRGKRNDSRNVKLIANKIAQEKEITLEEVAAKTYENAKNLFSIL